MISLIVAKDKNGVIGKAGSIPWKVPAYVAFFKKMTMGHPVIMGKKTFESIGRALPGRTNIVVTTDLSWQFPGCITSSSVKEAISRWEQLARADEVFVIGGGRVYAEAISFADRLYVTEINTEVEGGDTFFPVIDLTVWHEISREDYKADEKNQYDYNFVIYERSKNGKHL
ncbi:MAG: dihydrofolate reductase [Candidatus Vogelbacteria bacterium]|nr:dihydrofolate reductase [Candidatus Vogelbacteria bacterium]